MREVNIEFCKANSKTHTLADNSTCISQYHLEVYSFTRLKNSHVCVLYDFFIKCKAQLYKFIAHMRQALCSRHFKETV